MLLGIYFLNSICKASDKTLLPNYSIKQQNKYFVKNNSHEKDIQHFCIF